VFIPVHRITDILRKYAERRQRGNYSSGCPRLFHVKFRRILRARRALEVGLGAMQVRWSSCMSHSGRSPDSVKRQSQSIACWGKAPSWTPTPLQDALVVIFIQAGASWEGSTLKQNMNCRPFLAKLYSELSLQRQRPTDIAG
jgi:hypothetical protein